MSRNKKQGGENKNYANIARKGNLNQQAGAELNVPTSYYWAPDYEKYHNLSNQTDNPGNCHILTNQSDNPGNCHNQTQPGQLGVNLTLGESNVSYNRLSEPHCAQYLPTILEGLDLILCLKGAENSVRTLPKRLSSSQI